MPLNNQDIAKILMTIADMLEINGDNPYRIRAYRRAARRVETWSDAIAQLVENEADLTIIPYVGTGIAAHIRVIVKTGQMPDVLKTKSQVKQFRHELKQIEGLGQKRINLLRTQLNIETKQALIEAIQTGKLRSLKGFSEGLEQKILRSLANPKPYEKHFKFRLAKLIIEALQKDLENLENVTQVTCASSYRRKAEVIGNVDFLLKASIPKKTIEKFLKLDVIREIVTVSDKHACVILQSGMQVTVHIVSEEEYPVQLLSLTGSISHLEQLKQIARQKNFVLDEKGFFANKKLIHSQSEHDIYKQLGLNYIEPELRENRGEIAASLNNTLPQLITLNDIKGDLHSHTNETDGSEPLEVMVKAAMEHGYEYFAITDHSKRLTITNGLDEKRLMRQIEMINELNSKLYPFTILKSIEVDILEDGSLDLSNEILKELDLCVCSIHSKFKLPEDKQTERIIRAMDNPYFNILGHATGRLINSRHPYPINIERILTAAKSRGCFIELNAQPSRLDINDNYCLMAKSMGVKIAISSDAHSIRELNNMEFGIYQARRGWLEAHDVINTRSLHELRKLLKR